MRNKFNNNGFTLMELMIVVAIMGIMVTIGITSYNQALPQIQLNSARNDVINVLNYARMTAIYRNMDQKPYFDGVGSYSYGDDLSSETSWAGGVTLWFPPYSTKYNIPSFAEMSGLKGRVVTFNSMGRAPNIAGTQAIYLKSTNPTNHNEYRVDVEGASGIIYSEEWNTTGWVQMQ